MSEPIEAWPSPQSTEIAVETVDIDMPEGEWDDEWVTEIAGAVVDQLFDMAEDL